jgi:hypothetical protein
MSNRIKSAHRVHRKEHAAPKERAATGYSEHRSELTNKNLRDFEEKLGSQVEAAKKSKIVFSDKNENIRHKEKVEDSKKFDYDLEANEGEGEGDAEVDVENPNQADYEQTIHKEVSIELNLK